MNRALIVDIVLVGLIALLLRLVYAGGISFPPPDDPAYYVTVARNLVSGRGFTTDVIWQYHTLPASPLHPAGDLWMPLAVWLTSLSFAVFGVAWPAAQVPGVFLGSALAVLTYCVARDILAGRPGERGMAVAAGLLVACNGVLAYQSASADSSPLFALPTAMALWLAGWCAEGSRKGTVVATGPTRRVAMLLGLGVLVGLSYLARGEGALLLVVTAGLAAHRAFRERSLVTLGDWFIPSALVAVALVAPWLWRNYTVFGSAFPMPASRLALLTSYVDLFNYATPVSLERWWAQGVLALLSVRAAALWHNWHVVLDFLFFPTALLPVIGLWLLRRQERLRPLLWFGLLLFLFTALVFPVATLAGTFYHDVGSLAPFLAVGYVYLVRMVLDRVAAWRHWRRDLFWLVYATVLCITVVQFALTYLATSQEHARQAAQLTAAASWLRDHPSPVVMSTQPFNLNYLAEVPTLMLPVGERPEVVLELARRYGAWYLVIAHEFGLYPQALQDTGSSSAPGAQSQFRLLMRHSGVEIYEMR